MLMVIDSIEKAVNILQLNKVGQNKRDRLATLMKKEYYNSLKIISLFIVNISTLRCNVELIVLVNRIVYKIL